MVVRNPVLSGIIYTQRDSPHIHHPVEKPESQGRPHSRPRHGGQLHHGFSSMGASTAALQKCGWASNLGVLPQSTQPPGQTRVGRTGWRGSRATTI
jgi:hypothetical protein